MLRVRFLKQKPDPGWPRGREKRRCELGVRECERNHRTDDPHGEGRPREKEDNLRLLGWGWGKKASVDLGMDGEFGFKVLTYPPGARQGVDPLQGIDHPGVGGLGLPAAVTRWMHCRDDKSSEVGSQAPFQRLEHPHLLPED